MTDDGRHPDRPGAGGSPAPTPPAQLDEATTFLFVPGDRPDRFAKAAQSGADVVVLDLEDAVATDRKDDAREHVAAHLRAGGRSIVRVNAVDTPWYEADIAAVNALPGTLAIMLPKADERGVHQVDRLTSLPVIALIETATGVLQAQSVAQAQNVRRLALGALDLAADTDTTCEGLIDHARITVTLASRAAGLAAPVEGVTVDLDDPATLEAQTRHARSYGFTGKLCIHPKQVPFVARAMRPTEDEIAWARRVLEAAGDAAVVEVDGQMVDAPVLSRARALLARAAGENTPPADAPSDDERGQA